MTLIKSILLGAVQGITEFLPVSSSGHLVLLQHAFNVKESSLFFNTSLHIATLLVVLCYFRKDLIELVTQQPRYFMLVFWGLLPTLIVGLSAYNFLNQFFIGDIRWVGVFLCVTAGIIFAAAKKHVREDKACQISIGHALVIGCAQSIAILPGISRSGITIAVALLLGLSKKEAFRFSFILAIPSIIGAFVLQIVKEQIIIDNINFIILGMLTAFITGLGALKLLHFSILKGTWKYFSLYCLLMGLVIIIVSLMN